MGRWRIFCPPGPVNQAPSRWTTDYQRGLWPNKETYELNPATVLDISRGRVGTGWRKKGGTTACVCRSLTRWKRLDFWKTHSYLIGWRRCPHWRFHRSQRLTDNSRGGISVHHPASSQLGKSYLIERPLSSFLYFIFGFCYCCNFFFFWLFLVIFLNLNCSCYGLVFEEALL